MSSAGQAHELGTLILVPQDRLVTEFEQDRKRIEHGGLTLS
jgi:hypothetical protein